jgi:hypothetical protein
MIFSPAPRGIHLDKNTPITRISAPWVGRTKPSSGVGNAFVLTVLGGFSYKPVAALPKRKFNFLTLT